MRSCARIEWLAAGLLTTCLVLAGCSSTPDSVSTSVREAIYRRADTQFTSALLLKPIETAFTNSLAFRLAPLLLVEITSTNVAAASMPVPTVFYQENTVRVGGKTHDQVSYVWSRDLLIRNANRVAAWQGIRITLNNAGQPVIWEVLSDSSGAELVFVAQSHEAAVRREFGAVLAGRHFAAERSMDEAPNTVVARVIADGPVPMGPMVHLCAATGDISTLICRCMTTQTQQLAGQGSYVLQPQVSLSVVPERGCWPDADSASAALERKLRLPVGF